MAMLTANLNHPSSPDTWYYSYFPISEDKISKHLQQLSLPEIGTHKNCQIRQPVLLGSHFPMLDGQLCNLDELNLLAKLLSALPGNRWRSFLAVAEATHADTPEKLINLTDNLRCYSVISSFVDMEEIGKSIALNELGVITVNGEMDFRQYALDILAQSPLAATDFGLVYRNSNMPVQIYNGRQFPHQPCDGAAGMLTIYSEASGGVEYLDLPCAEIALGKALNRLGEEWLEYCEYSFKNSTLPQVAVDQIKDSDDPTGDFYALNRLAAAMSDLSKQQYADFMALCAWAKPDYITEHVKLCENLCDFQFVPGATNLREYGKKLLMVNWTPPDETAIQYIDFEGYVRQRLEKYPGANTPYGFLRYMGDAPDIAELAKLPFRQPNYITLRLFSPITCDLYEFDRNDEPQTTSCELSSYESADYMDSIYEMVIASNLHDDPRGLAPYLDSGSLSDKVYSMIPTVEEYGGRLFGVLECQLREPITPQEYEQLCDYWAGQASDGWGESVEQQEVKVADGILYVHFGSTDKSWKILSESELKGELSQGAYIALQ